MVQTLDRDARVTSPVLEEVFAAAARRLRARLATRVGTDVPVRVAGVRTTELSELREGKDFADAALWTTFATEVAGETAVVAIEGRLIQRLIGRLLGEGESESVPYAPRAVTEVEQRIGSRVSQELLDAVQSCWTMSVAPRFRLEQTAPSRRVCADLDGSTPMSVTSLEVSLGGEVIGTIFVGLAMSMLRRLVPRGAMSATPSPLGGVVRPPQFDRVMPVEVELVVELSRVSVPLRQLQSLRAGDELFIGTVSEAIARVGDQAIFTGEPGTSGALRSIRITSRTFSLTTDEGDR
jgi:flagellar motor switch protein FliM